MSGNSSSSFTFLPLGLECMFSGPSFAVFTSFVITSVVLVLPLCVFILHHGLQLWRQKRSTSSAAAVSNSDCFTYHMVIVELVGCFGCVLFLCSIKQKDLATLLGAFLASISWFGETFFHVLTCVERYLAVVHPITYLSLRNQRGIRIRNISITCAWLLCFVMMGLLTLDTSFVLVNLCIVLLSLLVTSFCSLSVLCVLIRPGPGEQGGGRERVDRSKQRAFYTIISILGVLVLRFSWGMVWAVMYVSSNNCVIMVSQAWFNLPGSLLLPLLFLHRAGKLVCWKKKILQ